MVLNNLIDYMSNDRNSVDTVIEKEFNPERKESKIYSFK